MPPALLQERQSLERQWSGRLQHARQGAQEAQAAQRGRVEASLASVVARVSEMAAREARQEKKRRQLLEQVTELRAASDAEGGKRREVEQALHTASRIFKKELAEKNTRLEALQAELSSLRACGWALPCSPPHHYLLPGVHLPGGSLPASPLIAAGTWAHPAGSPRTSPGPRPSRKSSLKAVAAAELALLKAARQDFQRAVAEHQEIKAALVRAKGEAAAREPRAAGSAAASPAQRALFT
jgi:hypothetical protein